MWQPLLDYADPTLDMRSGLSPVQLVSADGYEYSRFANDVIGVSNIERLTFFSTSLRRVFSDQFRKHSDIARPCLRHFAGGDTLCDESVVTRDHGQCLAIVQSGSAPALPIGNRLTVLLVTALPPA